MSRVHALLAQLDSAAGDTAANAERAAAVLREHRAADIAVFPELYLSAYDRSVVAAAARRPDCQELGLVAAAAAETRTAVVIGFAERRDDGIANSVACIDADGSLAAVYRKTQLFGWESEAFRPGSELVVVSLAGRRVAPMVCYDVEFPEVARQLALAGAELLVTSSANMEPYYLDHEIATRSRAHENRLPHLYANAVGTNTDFHFVGGSRSVDGSGEVLAEAVHDRVELLPAPIGTSVADADVDYLRHLPGPLPVSVL